MSLYGALFAGVSGLTAQSNTLSVISNNIANVNTVGFKGATGSFESLVTSAAGAAFSPGGVIASTQQQIGLQGQLQTTSSSTDIGILGNGFFVVNQASDGSGSVLYTRAGDFTQDKTGNFRNSAGFYLQGWPLDRNGLLPGAPGNTTNTTSSANLSSLRTVNVNNLTGSASATTAVSIGANLDASATASTGAFKTATLDTTDTLNYGSTGLVATGLIVPNTATDLLTPGNSTVGDSFKITTSNGVNATFDYGGIEDSNNMQTAHASTSNTLTDPPYTVISSTGGQTVIRVALTGANTLLANGDTVTQSGNTEDIMGIPAANFNNKFIVSNVQTNSYDITVTGTAATSTVSDFQTNTTDMTVIVHQVGSNLQTGDKVTISGATKPTGSSLANSDFDGTFTVTAIDADHYSITIGAQEANAVAASGGGTGQAIGGAGTITANTRVFTGNILNATSATSTFLGALPTTGFTTAGLTFTITNGTGTSTFTYVNGTPNASQGQFNTLANLATAITASSNGLSARVVTDSVNGTTKLWVGSVNANDQVTFNNGSEVGVSGPPLQSGIDWVGELGLSDIDASSTGNRWSSLEGLAEVINNTAGLTATVNNPTGTSSLKINVDSPLDTINFTDTTGNTGSPLAALGITAPLAGVAATTTTGDIAKSYDPADTTKSMASGSTTPQFSHPVQVFDSQGTAHNLNVAFIKTSTLNWAVEIYSVPAGDVQGVNDGQVASGNITFNGDGTLANISSALTQPISITWTDGASDSAVAFAWGTAGGLGVGKADGLSQYDSAYVVNFANQNGVPVGQLSSVSIDKDGFVTASYSNGQTQKLYQIPLAQFTNPNQLTPLSSNVYEQSESSGVVNLAQAGVGGAGSISASSLEASNVELANELTTMIIAQRSYEANTKVISTSDHLLQVLNQIIQ